MEFIIFLSKLDKEILDLLTKANYTVEENKIECLLNKEIKGLHNFVEKKIIILKIIFMDMVENLTNV